MLESFTRFAVSAPISALPVAVFPFSAESSSRSFGFDSFFAGK
jgi:hypothetical protein